MRMVCTKCKKDKTGDKFPKKRNQCKECRNKYAKGERGRGVKYKHRYGITIEQYNEMHKAQGGKCGICSSDKPGRKGVKNFMVDHCHKTKKIRGLLCHTCNVLLGNMKDKPEILKKCN